MQWIVIDKLTDTLIGPFNRQDSAFDWVDKQGEKHRYTLRKLYTP